MQSQVLEGGFADLPVDASYAFRAVMTAMARPGDIASVGGAQPPGPMSVAAGVVLLT
uniref:phosphonate C-P lyase system protein PhnH n=1 Tax=Sulfitobacter sp. TaxID=1903071 RepID=UPI003568D337